MNHSNTEEICVNRNVLIVKFTAIWYDYRQLFMKIYRKTSLSEVQSEWSATINFGSYSLIKG